ncbi:DUF4229 domain-containing protein [Cellulomonas sp. SG140]|uniref:DUF4229 domain-containing protein n=1 Tax=Cellulomonas sp. SG140 TaxID=2976536 RepID=UPI0021E9173A|nr:DUF4229 domain-containing protein [Cellulomonas sp. SG140]
MPVVVYSVLRVALLVVSWLLLTWAGLHPLAALLVAAFVAWGLSYVALGGPRDAAARYLAERAAVRAAHAGRPVLSPHAREDADVEDAAVDAALGDGVMGDEVIGDAASGDAAGDAAAPEEGAAERPADGDRRAGPGSAQSASASPSSMP